MLAYADKSQCCQFFCKKNRKLSTRRIAFLHVLCGFLTTGDVVGGMRRIAALWELLVLRASSKNVKSRISTDSRVAPYLNLAGWMSGRFSRGMCAHTSLNLSSRSSAWRIKKSQILTFLFAFLFPLRCLLRYNFNSVPKNNFFHFFCNERRIFAVAFVKPKKRGTISTGNNCIVKTRTSCTRRSRYRYNALRNAILSRVTSLRTFTTSASFARGKFLRKGHRTSKDAARHGAFRWSIKHAPIIAQIRGQRDF